MSSVMPQIENVVLLMLENRSLDNLLGWVYKGRTPAHFYPGNVTDPFDGLIDGAYANPAYTFSGAVESYPVVPVPNSDRRIPCYDPDEEYLGVVNQLFGNQNSVSAQPAYGTTAQMLGFLQDYYAQYMLTYQGLDILWTYTPAMLPGINGLAYDFAVSDRWFSSVPTQTNPNRAYSLCGTSMGRENNLNEDAVEQFDAPTIFNALAQAGKSRGLYYFDVWQNQKCFTDYTFPRIAQAQTDCEIAPMETFFERAAAGTLPAFTYLEPSWGYGKGSFYKQGNDFHPPTDVTDGDAFVSQVSQALQAGPQWPQTLLIVTFDEHGGTYDHVAPAWGSINPDGKKSPSGFDFNRFGVRVPTILASPYIAAQTIFRAPSGPYPFDHTSLIKTLLLWAGVDPGSVSLGSRMPAAPTFDGVLSDTPVNRTRSAHPPNLAHLRAFSKKGIDPMIIGVAAASARAIVRGSETVEEILRKVEAYRRDPQRFESALGG